MDSDLRRGIRLLGPMLRQENARRLLRSAGWTEGVPLTVALRSETLGDVMDRASGAAKTVILVFDPTRNTYTVAGYEPAVNTDEALAHGVDIESTNRAMPVASFEDHVLGRKDPFKDLRVSRAHTLAVPS